jgi:hypothetical protein
VPPLLSGHKLPFVQSNPVGSFSPPIGVDIDLISQHPSGDIVVVVVVTGGWQSSWLTAPGGQQKPSTGLHPSGQHPILV